MKQLSNHKLRDFAMAFRMRKLFVTSEKRALRCENSTKGLEIIYALTKILLKKKTTTHDAFQIYRLYSKNPRIIT